MNYALIYPDEHLLAELRRVAAIVDGPVTTAQLRRHSPIHPHTLQRRFGSWRAALVEAGLPHRYSGRTVTLKMRKQPARKFTDAEVLTELRRIAALSGGRRITRAAVRAHSATIGLRVVVDRFGSWPAAVAAAGLTQSPTAVYWSKQELLGRLDALREGLGRSPRATDVDRQTDMASSDTYRARFGSLSAALDALPVPPGEPPSASP